MSCNFFNFRTSCGCDNGFNHPCGNMCQPYCCCQGIPGPMGPQGATGAAAGFGTPTATITTLTAGSTPTVSVSASGQDTAKVFSFNFGIPAASSTPNDALYASSGAQTVTTNSIIPLTQTTATTGTTMSVSNNAITLQDAGIYLVSYGATGEVNDVNDNDLSIQLYANNTAISGEVISTISSSSIAGNVSKTILYNAATGTTLSIYNTSTENIVLTNANITVLKLI